MTTPQRPSRASLREGPLSELFRNTEALSSAPRAPQELIEDPRHPHHEPDPDYAATIRVVGVGGAGCNAVDRMVEAGIRGVDFVAVNTDQQALDASEAGVRVAVGRELTRGLGTGGDPAKGEQAVRESEDEPHPVGPTAEGR